MHAPETPHTNDTLIQQEDLPGLAPDGSGSTTGSRAVHIVDPAATLLVALAAPDMAAAREVTTRFHPDTFEGLVTEGNPTLADLDYTHALADPAVAILRSLAIAYSPDRNRNELSSHMREALHALIMEQRWDWAAFAGRWYHHDLLYREGATSAINNTLYLLEQHPELRECDANLVAAVAATLSFADRTDEAMPLWDEARSHPTCSSSANTHWNVEFEWVRSVQFAHALDLAGAEKALYSILSHFRDQSSAGARRRYCEAVLLLSAMQVMTCQWNKALNTIDEYGSAITLGGDFAAYLMSTKAYAAACVHDWPTAHEAIEEGTFQREVFSGQQLAIVYPLSAALALESGDTERASAALNTALRVDAEPQTLPLHRALWRLEFSHLLAAADPHQALKCATDAYDQAHGHQLPFLMVRAQAARARCAFQLLQAPGSLKIPHDKLYAIIDDAAAFLISAAGDPAAFRFMTADTHAIAALAHNVEIRESDSSDVWRIINGAPLSKRSAAAQLLAENDNPLLSAMLLAGSFSTGLAHNSATDLPPAITIRLLGEFSIRSNSGERVDDAHWSGRRKARQLLAHLVLAEGKPVHAHTIENALWFGKHNDSDVKRRLAPLVYVIRKAFTQVSNVPADQTLVVSRGVYTLKLRPTDLCDVTAFSRSARACINAASAEDAGQYGNDAIALYAGEFLPDEPEDDWIYTTRLELVALFGGVVKNMLDVGAELRDATATAKQLHAAHLLHPTSEMVCESLVRLCAATGDRSGASAVFQRTKLALQSEFEIEPSSSLQAALDRAMSH